MPEVRIFRPARSATQSGRANVRHWHLEFEPRERKAPDALMGWSGSGDTLSQLRLRFSSREEAIAFAQSRGMTFTVWDEPSSTGASPKSYADNFLGGGGM